MKRALGAILIGLGMLSFILSIAGARSAPNVSYLIGTFLPGVVFIIIGLLLLGRNRA